MEQFKEQFKFCDDGKVRYHGQGGKDTLMTIYIENGIVCIDNKSSCDDIAVPVSVISKLILDSDKNNIRIQLANYLAET